MERSDWHIFLAVARQGSTLAASRSLRVSQSTVSRRIDALEDALGLRLFDRSFAGYVPTPAGIQMMTPAEAIEQAVDMALTTAGQLQRGIAGQIRFTTFVAMAQTFLSAAVRDFRRAFPDIMVEIVASDARLDLLAGEADVAMRAGPAPQETGLVARRVMTDAWSIYCSPDYAAEHGTPQTPKEMGRHSVLTVNTAVFNYPFVHFIEGIVPDRQIVMRHNDVSALLAGLKDGIGVGAMSDMVAEAAGLTRCFVPPNTFESPVWLITTERLQMEPRIRALLDFLGGYMAQRRYRKPMP